jgi:hypothetical protein
MMICVIFCLFWFAVWVTFQEQAFMWILKKKYDYWWTKYGLEKTDRATKTSLFDRNWATSLKPRWRSRPLCLVWWALVLLQTIKIFLKIEIIRSDYISGFAITYMYNNMKESILFLQYSHKSLFLKCDPYRVWCSIFYSILVNCILLRSLFIFVKGRGTCSRGKETFGSIFGSLPDFPSLCP